MSEKLEGLYQEARTAFKAKNYARASDILLQILQIDENYKDTSRLLAQTVKLRRRRWYHHPLLWGAMGLTVLILSSLWFGPRLRDLYSNLLPTSPERSPNASGSIHTPTANSISKPRPSPTSTIATTPVPLVWQRISMGQEFQRDRIKVIDINSMDAEVLFAGGENAGIFKSIDGGESWKPNQNGLGRASIYSLVIDPLHPSTMYAGVSEAGVYKSTDGGDHWMIASEGIREGIGWKSIVILDRNQPNYLFYTEGSNIYASSDGADTWTEVKHDTTCPDEIAALALNPHNGAIVYVTNNHSWGNCPLSGVYQSVDRGQTWSLPEFEIIRPHNNLLLISPLTGNSHYVLTQEGFLYLSRDGGRTWDKEKGCGLLVLDPQDETSILCAAGGELQKYKVLPEKPEQTWWRVAPLPVSVDISDPFVISPHSSQSLFLGAFGIWASSDGGLTWNERSNGLGAGRIELRIDPLQTSTLYVDDANCVPFFSNDSGHTWNKSTGGGCGMSMSRDGKARYWLERAQDPTTLNISIDAGSTWTNYSFQQPIYSVVAHPTIPGRVYAICQKDVPSCIYVSSDFGQTWHKSTGINKLVIAGLFFSQDPDQRVYVVSGDWQIYASEDLGENWQESSTKAIHARSDETRMIIDPFDSNHLYLATLGRGILISSDGGQNWQESNAGLGSLFVNSLAFDPNSPDSLYAGTDDGAYISIDGGETWGQINDGLLGATVVYSIVVDKDSNVYAATPYGIFKLASK